MDRENGATTHSGDGQAMASESDQDGGPDQGGEPFPGQDADFAQEHASLTVDDFRLDRPAESDATP